MSDRSQGDRPQKRNQRREFNGAGLPAHRRIDWVGTAQNVSSLHCGYQESGGGAAPAACRHEGDDCRQSAPRGFAVSFPPLLAASQFANPEYR